MLDFGLAELLVIGCVLVFIIGPQDLPGLMHGLGRLVRRLGYMKHALSMQFDQMIGVVDPQEVNTTLQKDLQTPEIAPEDEGEAQEDTAFDPRPAYMQGAVRPEDQIHGDIGDQTPNMTHPVDMVQPIEAAQDDDPAIRDQQDLFAGPVKNEEGRS